MYHWFIPNCCCYNIKETKEVIPSKIRLSRNERAKKIASRIPYRSQYTPSPPCSARDDEYLFLGNLGFFSVGRPSSVLNTKNSLKPLRNFQQLKHVKIMKDAARYPDKPKLEYQLGAIADCYSL